MPDEKRKLLDSIINELTGLIRRDEGEFAPLVIGDVNDAIQRSTNQIKTAHLWLKHYRQLTY